MAPKPLDYESLNENVKKVQYAVRGELYLRASELQKEGKKVIALCQAPFLLDDPNVGLMFPADAIAKAKHYLSLTSGGLDILTMEDDDIIKRESSQPVETNSKKRKRA
ncbi:glutamate--glyoxylate aminotransferase 1-like [Euphorbia lathyris]|uniref:glutamate--glyoxylate aminotransferase 1-like n=1 Tax=Euphorbia lathyris TaxID=212925 RepID=UPI0033133672